MAVYIALLRGINVSGQKLIKMTELKRMFEELGYARVQTYIQSGNVVFESEEAEGPARRQIEQEIMKVFGFDVTVVLRTAAELEQVVGNCPFAADTLKEGERLYAALLPEEPSQKGMDRLLAYNNEIDEFRISGREVYILCRNGIGKSRFTNNFLEQKLGVPATTRNWQTINKLIDMANAMNA